MNDLFNYKVPVNNLTYLLQRYQRHIEKKFLAQYV